MDWIVQLEVFYMADCNQHRLLADGSDQDHYSDD